MRVRLDVESDGDRRAVRERPQRRAETALGQDRRVDAARELLQFAHRVRQPGGDLGQLGPQVAPVDRDVRLHGPHGQDE
jgi:hypothetical protein